VADTLLPRPHALACLAVAAGVSAIAPSAPAATPWTATWCTADRCQHRADVALSHSRGPRQRKLRRIAPYRPWLRSTGACESGGGLNLRSGLRALSPGGRYRGRYQFDWSSWQRAGGHGDPVAAGWVEQAFRAVRWREIRGTSAWPVCGA
jgi:hypothetical protein